MHNQPAHPKWDEDAVCLQNRILQLLLSLQGGECDLRHRGREPLQPLCSPISHFFVFSEHLLRKDFSESLPTERTRIPIVLWSGQPPATSLELVSEVTSRAFHTYLLPSPPNQPRACKLVWGERKASVVFHSA